METKTYRRKPNSPKGGEKPDANSPCRIENTQTKIKTEHGNIQKIGKELKSKPDAIAGETDVYNLNSFFFSGYKAHKNIYL